MNWPGLSTIRGNANSAWQRWSGFLWLWLSGYFFGGIHVGILWAPLKWLGIINQLPYEHKLAYAESARAYAFDAVLFLFGSVFLALGIITLRRSDNPALSGVNVPIFVAFLLASLLWIVMTIRGDTPPAVIVQTIVVALGAMFAKRPKAIEDDAAHDDE